MKVNFRTNVLLKSIIGKDLITDDNIAVLELVKNSFDAGSNRVELEFYNLLANDDRFIEVYPTNSSSRLVIRDFGLGMSEYDITNKWLNIAFSEKKIKKEEFGRVLAGNKGVGRFSCDRLGQYLTIYSRKKNKEIVHLFINWKWFEDQGEINLNIQDVDLEMNVLTELEYEVVTGNKPFDEGTILEISCLREQWTYYKILGLKRQLERLINPNQSFNKTPFEISIIAPDYTNDDVNKEEHERINGIVRNRIFETLNFKTTSIESQISSDGKVITTKLQDKGNIIFELVEKNKFNLLKNIRIYVYYLNPYSKAYFTRQTGIRSVNFGSIFLFINGFRIPPYGDDGDDWLGMENRKGQGHSRYLGAREVVGRIEIRDEDDSFKIISNRSGIVLNETFNQLTKNDSPYGYYYKIFRRLERYVVEGIKWDSADKDERKIEKLILEDPDWDESKETYIEDLLSKNKRVIQVVKNIIDTKKDEVVSLSINEDFVSQLIDDQVKKVKTEIDNIAEQINSKNLTSNDVTALLEKITFSSNELREFSSLVSPYMEISGYQDLENKFQTQLNELTTEKEKLEEKLKNEERAKEETQRALKVAEEQAEQAARELELEKEKNIYLRTSSRSLSEDAKGLVHNIKITSKKISSSVDNLYDKILKGTIKENEILKALGNIKFQAEKALKVSKIITRSNFNTDKNEQIIDVVKYINQYIGIYSDIYEKTELEFKIATNNSSLIKKISILDISIILDDLISNSEKAGAKQVHIEMQNPKQNNLLITFSDDGRGVHQKFLDNPSQIFELGITTTDGSGIGLNSVQTALKSMKGTIQFIGNGKHLKGACFQISLS